MSASTFTLAPDFSGSEGVDRAFWQLFRAFVADPHRRDQFRVVPAAADVAKPPKNGFSLPLSDGYILVFDPDAKLGRQSGGREGYSIVSAGPQTVTVTQMSVEGAKSRAGQKAVVLADPEYIFAPLWDVGANQPFCYITRLLWNAPEGQRLSEQSPEIVAGSLPRLLGMDLEAAERTVATIQQTLDAFGAGAFTIPVHPRILTEAGDRWRGEIWSLVLPVLDQIMFELVSGIDGSEAGKIEDAVTTLQGFGRPILVRTPPGVEAVRQVLHMPVAAVGLDGGLFAQTDADIPNFGDYAEVTQSGMPVYILGLTSVASTTAAINAGFAYVGSDAIAPPSAAGGTALSSDDPATLLRTLLAQRSAAGRK